FSFPDQDVDAFAEGDQALFPTPTGGVGFATVTAIDPEAGTVDLMGKFELGGDDQPTTIIRHEYVHPGPKIVALDELATRILEPSGLPPNPAAVALLRREAPRFVPGGGPAGGRFTDDLAEMTAWATQLDGSFVAVQGPPGTGKTFRGAHLIRTLILAGQRVGVTAFSHNAIANLVHETVEVMTRDGGIDRLHGIRKPRPDSSEAPAPGVEHTQDNRKCARDGYNLVAGTTWLFANDAMVDNPLDVLIVDEAGQLALADTLAACRSARNVVLLGDPSQLPQVSQAVHPHRSGDSVLQHVLGDDVTLPDDRGVFLSETRRMHPDVCRFISDEIYDGRLHSHESCAQQTTELGTGLRWLRADHQDCVTESEEEAALVVAQIAALMGTEWTNQHGVTAPLTPRDFMVVAPYNDQVHLLLDLLGETRRTRDVPVGTVDKFQGRQAAVVFFTMTTSSAHDMVRGANFLFSRNRLNVAISRARCLAYLVCTEELLDSRARDVEEMRLLSTLCSFAEHAVEV
ncbi:MAG TPA: ATP-binding protein, partial [Acidimicrobiales bacterium]|nr:ATP-binding protein [Acidimicrobiales bacterium]